MRYAVVVLERRGKYLGSVPDLPGCVALADTPDELRRRLSAAIRDHLELLRRQGQAMPEPRAYCEVVEV